METLLNMLPIIQIALAIILTGSILLQQRGAGLGGAFGGADGGVHYERRGFERTLFKATGVIAVLFVVSVMISVLNGNSSNVEVIGNTATSTATNTNATNTDEAPFTLTPEDITVETGDGEIIKDIDIKTNVVDITNTANPEESAIPGSE